MRRRRRWRRGTPRWPAASRRRARRRSTARRRPTRRRTRRATAECQRAGALHRTRTMAPGTAWTRPRWRRARRAPRSGGLQQHGRDQRGGGGGEHREQHEQHGPLAAGVGEPRDQRRGERVRERAGGGHGARYAVLPGGRQISKTVPSPNIDIGIRSMTPAAEKRQARGSGRCPRTAAAVAPAVRRGIGRSCARGRQSPSPASLPHDHHDKGAFPPDFRGAGPPAMPGPVRRHSNPARLVGWRTSRPTTHSCWSRSAVRRAPTR